MDKMWLYYFALFLTIVATLFYHIIQKMTPVNVNPVLSILFTYMTAAVLCVITYPFLKGSESLAEEIKKINWTSIALGFAIFCLEVGFLLAYRTGWNISVANLITSSVVAVVLIPIGVMAFNEKLSLINVVGIILCFIGIIFIKYK